MFKQLNIPKIAFRISIICLATVSLTSCFDTKKAIYFNNITDSKIPSLGKDDESLIQPNDILSIQVTSLNPLATEIFNTPSNTNKVSSAGTTTSVSGESVGYLVNRSGLIQFPVLGNIKVSGLTKTQLTQQISDSLSIKKLLVDPIVNVRFLNFRVTVLGEVGKPTVVNVPNEKISILEAIGMAGDLTIYANRENVLLIREENGVKEIKRLNLNSNEIFSSPYYYLRSNDVVYAEPNKAKVRISSQPWQLIPIALSGVSLLIIAIDRIGRN